MKKLNRDDWYTVQEVAQLLGIHRDTLYKRLLILKYKKPDKDDIPMNDNENYRIGKDSRLWKKTTIDNYLKNKELKNDDMK